MTSLMIFAFSTLCSVFLSVGSLPTNVLLALDGRYYQLIPLSTQPLSPRSVRDIFPESTDQVPASSVIEVKEHTENDKTDKYEVSTIRINQSNEEIAPTTEKKEILKPVSSDGAAIFKLLHRSRRARDSRQWYDDSDDYYEDRDYAGYDRRGSGVGYMDDHDDFPTVVW